jgi:L-threonylcarbamoyladenylate synthase
MIGRETVEALIGPVQLVTSADGPHPAPGLHHRHYSPRTPLYEGTMPAGRGAWVWWRENRPADSSIRMPADPDGYAAQLYQVLHELDARDLDFIALEALPIGAEWDGVRDRIRRAAQKREATDRMI